MEPILKGRNLVKRYGKVTALDHCDFDLYPGEILAVIGDNGAGKSTLIKAVSGAVIPDAGDVWLEGKKIQFTTPIQAREHGIETVYQTLAMSPALSIADNIFMGREIRKSGFMGKVMRQLDRPAMEKFARDKLTELGLMTIQNINQAVETLSGGQRLIRFFRTGHIGHGIRHRMILRVDDTKTLAQPVNVNAVCNLEHMWHVVADQDDRDATRFHILNELKNPAAFLDA